MRKWHATGESMSEKHFEDGCFQQVMSSCTVDTHAAIKYESFFASEICEVIREMAVVTSQWRNWLPLADHMTLMYAPPPYSCRSCQI